MMSVLLALIANTHRDPKRRAFSPRDFNPYTSTDDRQVVENLGEVRAWFKGMEKHGD